MITSQNSYKNVKTIENYPLMCLLYIIYMQKVQNNLKKRNIYYRNLSMITATSKMELFVTLVVDIDHSS